MGGDGRSPKSLIGNVNCYNPLDEMCAICIKIGNRLDPEVPTPGLLPVEIKASCGKDTCLLLCCLLG